MVVLSHWLIGPSFIEGQVVGEGGEGGGLWGLLRINYEGLKFHLCLKGACVVSLVHASTFTCSSWLP